MEPLKPLTDLCPYCGSGMHVTEMACGRCGVTVQGGFPMSRLGRLPVEHQRFVELFVLCGGNLKELAQQVGVSYPTIRSRLDRVIDMLREEIAAAVREDPPGSGGEASRASAKMIRDIPLRRAAE